MKKINLGCGGNRLAGWENHDMDVDISKPLPFHNNSADFIFAEHVVEHVDAPTAFGFFEECLRVLKPSGVLRVTVPSITRVWQKADEEHLRWAQKSGFGDGTYRGTIKALIVQHGHKCIYSEQTLGTSMFAAGFDDILSENVGLSSRFPELRGVEGHGKVIGDGPNWVESIVVEGVKP